MLSTRVFKEGHDRSAKIVSYGVESGPSYFSQRIDGHSFSTLSIWTAFPSAASHIRELAIYKLIESGSRPARAIHSLTRWGVGRRPGFKDWKHRRRVSQSRGVECTIVLHLLQTAERINGAQNVYLVYLDGYKFRQSMSRTPSGRHNSKI